MNQSRNHGLGAATPPGVVAALLFAAILPSLGAWIYFVVLAGNQFAQPVYTLLKLVQFALPLIVFSKLWPARETAQPLRMASVRWGLLTGFACLLGGLLLYGTLLRGSPLALDVAVRVQEKLHDFDATEPAGFLALALFLSLGHSLLEEYYYRWFFFRELDRRLSRSWALWLQTAAFTAHHVIVIGVYAGGTDLLPGLVGVVAVAAAGFFWAWLYARHRSLLGPWISHVCADLLVMTVGWDAVEHL